MIREMRIREVGLYMYIIFFSSSFDMHILMGEITRIAKKIEKKLF